jgi:hypothetical protein
VWACGRHGTGWRAGDSFRCLHWALALARSAAAAAAALSGALFGLRRQKNAKAGERASESGAAQARQREEKRGMSTREARGTQRDIRGGATAGRMGWLVGPAASRSRSFRSKRAGLRCGEEELKKGWSNDLKLGK